MDAGEDVRRSEIRVGVVIKFDKEFFEGRSARRNFVYAVNSIGYSSIAPMFLMFFVPHGLLDSSIGVAIVLFCLFLSAAIFIFTMFFGAHFKCFNCKYLFYIHGVGYAWWGLIRLWRPERICYNCKSDLGPALGEF